MARRKGASLSTQIDQLRGFTQTLDKTQIREPVRRPLPGATRPGNPPRARPRPIPKRGQ